MRLQPLEAELGEAWQSVQDLLDRIPNPPAQDTPDGATEEDAAVVKLVGDPPVFSFERLPGAERALGPEMRSTGEVMASAFNVAGALAKAERAAGRLSSVPSLPDPTCIALQDRPGPARRRRQAVAPVAAGARALR